MILFCSIVFSDPGMLPIHLLTGTYFFKGNLNPFKLFIIFTSN